MSNQIDPVTSKVNAFNAASAAITALSQLYWATGGVNGGLEIELEPIYLKRAELRAELEQLPVKFSDDLRTATVIA